MLRFSIITICFSSIYSKTTYIVRYRNIHYIMLVRVSVSVDFNIFVVFLYLMIHKPVSVNVL